MPSKNQLIDVSLTLCNFIALNVVFLITCMPLFTIGAALGALYRVMMQEARGEYGYLVRPYLREFKEDFFRSTKAFLLLAVLGFVFSFNFFFWRAYSGVLGTMLSVLFALGGMLILISALYTFPLLARFEASWIQTLRNAIGIALSHPKETLLLLLIDVIGALIGYYLPPMRILLLLFGFAFLCYVKSFLFAKVFTQYE